MRKADELKGPSCLTNADDDEPLFVLRANDESAPVLVLQWANRYWLDKMEEANRANRPMLDRQVQKFQDAVALAGEMSRWKKAKGAAEKHFFIPVGGLGRIE